MHSEEFKEEMKFVGKAKGVSYKQITEIVRLTFLFIRKVLTSADAENGYFPTIRVMGLGVFFIPKKTQKRMMKKYNSKKTHYAK